MTHDFYIVPFKCSHLENMDVQQHQGDLYKYEEYLSAIEHCGEGYTAFKGAVPIGAAGMFTMWENRAVAWAVLSRQATGTAFMQTHHAVKRYLDIQAYRRMEMYVRSDFKNGIRWARALGFRREGTMQAFCPDGRDFELFARVRK